MTTKFKLNKSFDSPENVDFDIMRLYKKYIVVKGELVSVEYYREFDNITKIYSDLVVKIINTYNRSAIGIIQNRISVIEFYCEDNSIGTKKTWTKYYPDDQAIDEGIKRRKNLIAQAKVVLLRELKTLYGEPANQQLGFQILLGVKTQMQYFEEGYTQPLRDAISNSTTVIPNTSTVILTSGIKTLIISELTY